MKIKIDKTEAPKGYYAAKQERGLGGCDGCDIVRFGPVCRISPCFRELRKDGQDVIFRKIKKGGTP